MHDFHLADKIYKTIIEYAHKNSLKKITKVKIDLGSMVEHGEEVLAENLAFNIKMLAQDGLAEGLEVEVRKVSGDEWKLVEIEGE